MVRSFLKNCLPNITIDYSQEKVKGRAGAGYFKKRRGLADAFKIRVRKEIFYSAKMCQ